MRRVQRYLGELPFVTCKGSPLENAVEWRVSLVKAPPMTTTNRKELLKKLIEAERDPAVLELVDNVLQRRTRGLAFQSDLVQRVLKSEEDYKAGRFQSVEEFEKDMDQFTDSLCSDMPNNKKRK